MFDELNVFSDETLQVFADGAEIAANGLWDMASYVFKNKTSEGIEEAKAILGQLLEPALELQRELKRRGFIAKENESVF